MRTEYNIYCDESCHLENDNIKPMALGCVWCPKSERQQIFQRLREIKVKHNLPPTCELKWNAVSPSKLNYYCDVANYFFDKSNLHFRVLIVPDKTQLNHKVFNQTHDAFYYKMYFDLLKTILDPKCAYEIFLDIKDTQGQEKVEKLQQYLCNSAYDFERKMLQKVQQIRSHEVELIQLADFLTGAICYAHRDLKTSSAKKEIITLLRKRSGYSLLKSTLYKEDKMNIFVWKRKEL
jgi:hypothetical protein